MAEKEASRAGTRSWAPDSGPATRDSAEAKSKPGDAQRPQLPATIATFAKNRRELVHVTLNRFEGISLVDIRCFAGELQDIATKRGISLRVSLLPTLIEALQQAEIEALKRGLIGGGT